MNKNYSNKQKYKDIQNDEKLLDCYEKVYKTENKKEIKRIFASNSAPDYGADRFLSENKNILEFLKIKAECRID